MRELIISRDHGACRVCGSTNNLQVHHRQYQFIVSIDDFKKPWDYEESLLITLCRECHDLGHEQHKVPVIRIE